MGSYFGIYWIYNIIRILFTRLSKNMALNFICSPFSLDNFQSIVLWSFLIVIKFYIKQYKIWQCLKKLPKVYFVLAEICHFVFFGWQIMKNQRQIKIYFRCNWILAVKIIGLVSSGVSLTSRGEDASLALVSHHSSNGITIKIPYGVDVLLHRSASHPIFSYLVG